MEWLRKNKAEVSYARKDEVRDGECVGWYVHSSEMFDVDTHKTPLKAIEAAMKRRKLGIGNCPVCGFAVNTIGNGKTPRHKHIRNPWSKEHEWLPPCTGSGKPADNYQELTPNPKKP